MLENCYKNINYVLLDDQMYMRQSSLGFDGLDCWLMPGSENFKSLQCASKNMRNLLSGGVKNICNETLWLNGFGKAKLLSSKNEGGEIDHLLLWGNDLLGHDQKSSKNTYCTTGLTCREKDVVEQLITGKNNKLIARHLSISTRTVENHLRSIYEKMGVHSRAQIMYAIYSDGRAAGTM